MLVLPNILETLRSKRSQGVITASPAVDTDQPKAPFNNRLQSSVYAQPAYANKREPLDKRFYSAVDDAIIKSQPYRKLPEQIKSVTERVFSLRNLAALEKLTGLSLLKHKPEYIEVTSYEEEIFNYVDLKVMMFRAVQEDTKNLPFFHNYLKHKELDERVQSEIIELEKQLDPVEIQSARSLIQTALVDLGDHLSYEDLSKVELRSGIPANSFTFEQLKLNDIGKEPGTRFYSRRELYKTLLEATLVNEKPAPYVYYHANADKVSEYGSFDAMSHNGHRLDHYKAESRATCERGRYIWTKKIFDICKAIGVDRKNLPWDQFMAMVAKVNEICVRHLKYNDRVSRRVRHLLTKDELHELCRSLNIDQQHLVRQETIDQIQGRINVGGCSGPPIP